MTYDDLYGSDIIDSRSIIECLANLESEVDGLFQDWLEDQGLEEAGGLKERFLDEKEPEEQEQLEKLRKLNEDGENFSDWTYGTTLVLDSYFEDFARQEAEDLGLLKDDAQWPYTCIDWEQAASELQQDYSSIDFDGLTYWVRS